MQKKTLGILLVLCMLLGVLLAMPASAAPATGTEVELTSTAVVYVKENGGSDTNDGSAPDKAFQTLTKAYQALAANGGTIVICDKVTLTYNAASGLYSHLTQSTHTYYAAPQCGGPVKVTSKYGSYDFTGTAVLGISIYVLRNDHIFDDIKIENMTTAGGFSALGNDLTIGENVTCAKYINPETGGGGQYPMIHSGLHLFNSKALYFGSSVDSIVWKTGQTGFEKTNPIVTDHYQPITKGTDGDNTQDIVVNSGTWRNVRGGNFRTGTSSAFGYLDHTLNITINGGTINPIMDNIQSGALMMVYSSATAASNFTINGGTFNGGAIYLFGRNGVNTQKTIEGNHSLTINGGTFNNYCLIAGAQATTGASSDSSLPTDTASVLQASGVSTLKITGGTFGENVAVKTTATDKVADVFTGNDAALNLYVSKAVVESMQKRIAFLQFSNLYDATTSRDYCAANGHFFEEKDADKHVCICCTQEAAHSTYENYQCVDCGADQPIITLTVTALNPWGETVTFTGDTEDGDVTLDFASIVVEKIGDNWTASNLKLAGADKAHYKLAADTCVFVPADGDVLTVTVTDNAGTFTVEVYKGNSFSTTAASAPAGYEFVGWYDATGTLVTGDETYTTPVYENITLTAKYDKNEENKKQEETNTILAIAVALNSNKKYTISFKSVGAKLYNAQTLRRGQMVVLPEIPVKEGYTFAGWCTDINGTRLYDFSKSVTKSMTLYAKWVKN